MAIPDKQRRDRERDRKRTEENPRWCWHRAARWRRKAKARLAVHPLCANLEREGRVTAATIADHVIPHRGDAKLFRGCELQSPYDESPWRGHSNVKQREERGSV